MCWSGQNHYIQRLRAIWRCISVGQKQSHGASPIKTPVLSRNRSLRSPRLPAPAKAPLAIFGKIAKAIPAVNPVVAVQVHAALAAATKDTVQLDAAIAAMAEFPAPEASKMPTTQQITDNYGSERTNELLRATAVAEVVRALSFVVIQKKRGRR